MITLFTISDWRIFRKIGKPGWVSLIPIYNLYAYCQALFGSGAIFLLLLIPFVNFIFLIVLMVKTVHAFGKNGWWTVCGIFLFPAFMVAAGLSDWKFKEGYLENGDPDFIEGFIAYFKNYKVAKENNPSDSNKGYCLNCGTKIKENAKFCHKCGIAVE